jgi:endonuclease/exonuclease/phosphatase (EEP) superfamily protein YafD
MNELRLLFWNMGQRSFALELAVELCRELRPHLFVTAETPDGLLNGLLADHPGARLISRTDRLRAIALAPELSISAIAGGHYAEAFTLQTSETCEQHLLVAVHVESQLWQQSPDDQGLVADQLHRFIEGVEARLGHGRTVVIGDFNMDPFSPAMVDIRGLNAMVTRRRAARGVRTARRIQRNTFYNPMWNLLGDDEPPSGSYYWKNPGARGYFWHMLDQVLVRGELSRNVSSVRLMTGAGTQPLVSRQGLPLAKASDHLPLFVEIQLVARTRGTHD